MYSSSLIYLRNIVLELHASVVDADAEGLAETVEAAPEVVDVEVDGDVRAGGLVVGVAGGGNHRQRDIYYKVSILNLSIS